jgi:sorbitol/mannitol transport system permease protein
VSVAAHSRTGTEPVAGGPSPRARRRRAPAPGPGRTLTAAQRMARRAPLLPALVITVVVTQLPFLVTIYYSLQDWNLQRPDDRHFAGLSNYTKAVTDSRFRDAAVNTVTMTAGAVVISMLLGLCCAVLLDRKFFGRGLVRTLLISPFLIMPVAAALLWKYAFFNPTFGLLDALPGLDGVDWVSRFPKAAIITTLVWQWTPFMMLIVLAGLQGQSTESLEAAKVDGAGPWQTFRYITFPHLRQYIELGLLLGSIYLVQTFDAIFSISRGGPGTSTTNLPYYLYQSAFNQTEVGYAAALGVVTVVATIIVSTFALRVVSSLFAGSDVMTR